MNGLIGIGNNENSLVFNVSGTSAKNEDRSSREGGSVYAGDMKILSDIDARRKQGQKQAMKIVSDAFDKEASIDNKVEKMRKRVSELDDTIDSYKKEIDHYNSELEKIKKNYDLDDEKELKKDLAVYSKWEASKEDDRIELTESEKKRLEEMDKQGVGAYYDMNLRLRQTKKDMSQAKQERNANVAGIDAIRVERLKTHTMADAFDARDEKLDDLGRELMGMAVAGAKDKIDEDLEEQVKAAKEKAKEKEEEEEKEAEQEIKEEKLRELTENIKDNSEEIKEENRRIRRMTEDILDGEAHMEQLEMIAAPDAAGDAADMAITEIGIKVTAAGKESSSGSVTSEDVQRELHAIMDKMKLLAEDFKGAAVDSII